MDSTSSEETKAQQQQIASQVHTQVTDAVPSSTEAAHRVDTVREFKRRGEQTLLLQMEQELAEATQAENPILKQEDASKFLRLFERYLSTRGEHLNWEAITPPDPEVIEEYANAHAPTPEDIPEMLSRVAVLKLNGGLGTSMGCTGPKSAIEVKDHLNFIDLSVRQIEHLNSTYNAQVPLLLMNSFRTQKETLSLTGKYKDKGILSFEQSSFPRIFSRTLMPVVNDLSTPQKEMLYPPGHGDIFGALLSSGVLDRLLSQGKDILFVSNADNVRATVDLRVLNYFIQQEADFLMEVTNKTRADIKGGTLIQYEGVLRLLEIAQVPERHRTDFASTRKFKIFNTNSVWINLKALKTLLERMKELPLEVIENKKKLTTGEEVIQLETAIGAAIRHFNRGRGLIVPRERFLPVKTCSDLFLLRSSLFCVRHGSLAINSHRVSESLPLVRLVGSHFKSLAGFRARIKGEVVIDDLEHLTVSGDVSLGHGVVLRGTVIIIAAPGQSIHIPDGTVLDDKIVTGSLSVIDH